MNRLVIVALAAVVALGSGVGLVAYVAAAEDRATQSAEPVPVLVAARDIADGTSFEEAMGAGAIVVSDIPLSMRPDTAVTDTGELAGLIADGGMRAGQVVVHGEFAPPGERPRRTAGPTFADALDEGSVAVSFEATGADAVAELIQPGDRVNLLVQVPDAAELGLAPSDGPAVVHVFQDLEVLAIGEAIAAPAAPAARDPEAEGDAGGSTATGAYTVAVAPRDAARVLLLTRQYPVFVTLVAPGTEPEQLPPVGRADAVPETLTADEAVERRR